MLTLKATKRKILGKKTKFLRDKDIIPTVVYGYKFEPIIIQVAYQEFEKIYKEAGKSSIINLEIDKENPIKSIIYDIQYHPVTDKIQHVDFYKIKAGQKVKVEVVLNFIGASPVVKELGGSLIINLDKVEVECLPEDLIHEIDVDVSVLTSFGKSIRVKDLKVPQSVEILQDSEATVIHAEEPRKEKEVEEEPTEEIKEPEKIGDKKEDQEDEEEKEKK